MKRNPDEGGLNQPLRNNTMQGLPNTLNKQRSYTNYIFKSNQLVNASFH